MMERGRDNKSGSGIEERYLKMDRETVTGKKRQSVPDKVTFWGDQFWSAADTVEAGIGRTSRAVSIKPLKGCPAKHCYKRVMALIFS